MRIPELRQERKRCRRPGSAVPIEGIDPYLMPAAHALVQAGEELERAALGLEAERLWARPGGAASVGFHLRHVAGSIDRLLDVRAGAALDEAQLAFRREAEPGDPPESAETLIERDARRGGAGAGGPPRRPLAARSSSREGGTGGAPQHGHRAPLPRRRALAAPRGTGAHHGEGGARRAVSARASLP